MKSISLLFLVFFTTGMLAQKPEKSKTGGMLSLGLRSSLSLFNEETNEMSGKGVGGQFRLRFAEDLNSEWFFDYLTSDILNYAFRTDYHIGWSVMYYPLAYQAYYKSKEHKLTLRPYIIAGHCFDYTAIQSKANKDIFADRWSSAIQAGIGNHFELGPRFDLSLSGQYMVHLGKHLHSDYNFSTQTLVLSEEKGQDLAGHLLLTLSLNYKIARLWGK